MNSFIDKIKKWYNSRWADLQEQENKKVYQTDGSYLMKMKDGYYKAFSADGTEVTGVNLPINICLRSLRGELPSSVRVMPSDEDIEMEPELKSLRDRF